MRAARAGPEARHLRGRSNSAVLCRSYDELAEQCFVWDRFGGLATGVVDVEASDRVSNVCGACAVSDCDGVPKLIVWAD